MNLNSVKIKLKLTTPKKKMILFLQGMKNVTPTNAFAKVIQSVEPWRRRFANTRLEDDKQLVEQTL